MMTLDPPRGLPEGADAWRFLGLSRSGLSRFLYTAQRAMDIPGEVDVLLASDQTLRRLNRKFRAKNKPTDVLSFPAPPELVSLHAGDVAISMETAARQASEHGHTLRDEVRILLLHGLLHLHGMDHESDSGEMAARETELRTQLRLPAGLIARAASHVPSTRPKRSTARKRAEQIRSAPGPKSRLAKRRA